MPQSCVPEKWVWTDADFEAMGWLNTTIHAMAGPDLQRKLLFDIDYVLEWIQPTPDDLVYKFWVAPATLVFDEVHNLKVTWSPSTTPEIAALCRGQSQKPSNYHFRHLVKVWPWRMDCGDRDDVNFMATGFTQFIRRPPVLSRSSALSLDERGGYSFARSAHYETYDA